MSLKCQRRILAFLMAMTLAAACDSTAYCSHPREEAHLSITGGHIYVVPRNGLFHKIEKDSGRIIWTSQVKYEGEPFRGGSYTEPVFVKGQFVTIETFGLRMLSIDSDTGNFLSEQQFQLHSGGTYSIYTPLLCGDLLVSGASSGVQAFGLEDRSQKWSMGYGSGDFVFLLGYFQKGDILFLLVKSLIDEKLINTAEIFLAESFTKF